MVKLRCASDEKSTATSTSTRSSFLNMVFLVAVTILIFDGDGLACAGSRTCSPWLKVHVGQVVEDVDGKPCAVPCR